MYNDYNLLIYYYLNDSLNEFTDKEYEYNDKKILEKTISKLTNQNSQDVINDLALKLSFYSSNTHLPYLALRIAKHVDNNELRYQILKNVFNNFCYNNFNHTIVSNAYMFSVLFLADTKYEYNFSKKEVRKMLIFTSRLYFSRLQRQSTLVSHLDFLSMLYHRFIKKMFLFEERKFFINIFCRTFFNDISVSDILFNDNIENKCYIYQLMIIINHWSLINDKNKKIIKQNIKKWVDFIKEKQRMSSWFVKPYSEVIQVIIENI